MIHTTEQLWHALHTDLLAFINRRISDQQTAEDIMQDVFIRIHQQIGSLRDETRLESWIYQITRNAIIDHYRSRKPDGELPETLRWEAADEAEVASRLAPCVKLMVDDLPEKYRETLYLTEYQGLTQVEAAERLRLSVSAVKSRVQRARDQIKSSLLQCCHFEFDRLNRIIDYQPNCNCQS
jgi:RNA polymerase sigma-70 factor, ECF subfamily